MFPQKSLLHPCDATEYLRQLIFLDAIAVCARIAIIIKDPRQRRDFFSKRGNDAQSLLDLLQEVRTQTIYLSNCESRPDILSTQLLDHPELDIAFRSPFIDALLKLSGASGLYPEHFVIKGIQLVGTEPVAEGRFGEVWKGSIRGRTVAVKVLRLYVKTDLEKHQKVGTIP
jgi:hypothetical protein